MTLHEIHHEIHHILIKHLPRVQALRSLTAEFKGAATTADGLLAVNFSLLTAYLLQSTSSFRSK